jgi:hypothetical protein
MTDQYKDYWKELEPHDAPTGIAKHLFENKDYTIIISEANDLYVEFKDTKDIIQFETLITSYLSKMISYDKYVEMFKSSLKKIKS